MNSKVIRNALESLHPKQIIPILIVSLISALVVTTYQISFGSLIFNGTLSPYLSNGIGFCLMGVVLITSIEAVFSGNPGMIAIPTVGSAVIVASISANISASLANSPQQIFPTVTAGITIASMLTGTTFILLGWMRMGNLIRFIPYPVIGGFLAGTGWLVAKGSLKTMNGFPLELSTLDRFLQQESLLRWLPGIILGVILLLVSRRFKHYLVTPGAILFSIALFYLILYASGTSIPQAVQMGLLFEPFPPGSLWSQPPLGELAAVDWITIAHQAAEIITLILISSITILLYASGIEVTAGTEIDLNRELRACGVGNLAASLASSIPGYTIITMSVLSHRLGARSRLVGLLVAAMCAGMLFFGAGLISFFPKPVLGGVLSFMSLTFLIDWLVIGFRRLSKADYLIVVTIMLVMSIFGLLEGLGIGITLAAGLFIYQYSQIPVIRHIRSGRSFHSRVARTFTDEQLLRQKGHALTIFELQGFVFFGTANGIYEKLKVRLQDEPAGILKVVMLDFRRVSGVDASAALSFVRLKRLLFRHEVLLVFTNLQPDVELNLQQEVLTHADQKYWRVFPDLDHGVEWFEDWILASESNQQHNFKARPGAVQPSLKGGGLAMLFAAMGEEAHITIDPADEAILSLMEILKPLQIEAGHVIINQGEKQNKLYFLDSGELSVAFQISGSENQVRLEMSGPGTIVGELGFYLGVPASATVTASQPSTIFYLSIEELDNLEVENPSAAAILHRFLIRRVSQRLLSALETVDILTN